MNVEERDVRKAGERIPAAIEYLDHTADIGLRVRGGSLEEVFQLAAAALVGVMVSLERIEPLRMHRASCRSESLEGLLVEWLSELLVQKDLSGLVFSRFDVCIHRHEGAFALEGSAFGEPLDSGKHEARLEVKGISYLGLRVAEEESGWLAECVVDV